MNKNSFYLNLYNKIESFKPNVLEIICFVLYIIGTIVISCFHEPWFDEFQAWGISKDSIYNILFVIPHYECHPPLWHLILKCFTSLNLPAELCLKIPNLLFMSASVWLIIFKSPFPRALKLTLPFTYFIFYQLAIVNRPYSMLTFALLLSTYLYGTKDEKPIRFILSLAFLTLTSLYGMIIATAMTLVWVFEIWNKQNVQIFLKNFLKDKRFFAMLGLFFFCCIITILVLPDKNISSCTLIYSKYSILIYLYLIFGLLGDLTFLDIYSVDTSTLSTIYLPYLITALLISLYITYVLFKEFKKQKCIRYLSIFYFLVSFFSFYIWPHHLGIPFSTLITVFWLLLNNKISLVYKPSKEFVIILAITIFVQITWSICSSLNEIQYNFGPGRSISKYIKTHSLEKYKIFSNWSIREYYKDKKGKRYSEISKSNENENLIKETVENTNYQVPPIWINPYYNKNIFDNFNIYTPDKLHLKHYIPNLEENEKTKQLWYKNGKPDIIIASYAMPKNPFFKYVKDYIAVEIIEGNTIWKTGTYGYEIGIYTNRDLYLKLKNLKK